MASAWRRIRPQQQFEIDKTICKGEGERANLSGATISRGGVDGAIADLERSDRANDVARGCMAEKCYLQVRADKADGTATALAATAAQRGAIAQQQPVARGVGVRR